MIKEEGISLEFFSSNESQGPLKASQLAEFALAVRGSAWVKCCVYFASECEQGMASCCVTTTVFVLYRGVGRVWYCGTVSGSGIFTNEALFGLGFEEAGTFYS